MIREITQEQLKAGWIRLNGLMGGPNFERNEYHVLYKTSRNTYVVQEPGSEVLPPWELNNIRRCLDE